MATFDCFLITEKTDRGIVNGVRERKVAERPDLMEEKSSKKRKKKKYLLLTDLCELGNNLNNSMCNETGLTSHPRCRSEPRAKRKLLAQPPKP